MDRIYHFAIRAGRDFEELGWMALPDDAGALAFADGIVRDLICDGRAQYDAACAMVITKGERMVANVSFARART